MEYMSWRLRQVLKGEIPPLANVLAKVTEDYKLSVGIGRAARHARRKFCRRRDERSVGRQGVCRRRHGRQRRRREDLTPFSLSTTEGAARRSRDGPPMDDAEGMGDFATPVGKASRFIQTEDGGFVIYVAARAPGGRSQTQEGNAGIPGVCCAGRGRTRPGEHVVQPRNPAGRRSHPVPVEAGPGEQHREPQPGPCRARNPEARAGRQFRSP